MGGVRLAFLIDELGVSFRKIDEKTGVTYYTICRLLSGKSQLIDDYIKRFCNFFNVTSDFLLGINDKGYIVYCNDVKIILSYEQAIKYKDHINISEKELLNTTDSLPNTYLYREIKDTEIAKELLTATKLKDIIDNLEYYKNQNILDFINKYIL